MKHLAFLCALFVVVGMGFNAPASAQQRRAPASAPQPAPPAPAEPAPEVPPTYEPELLRLAEVLGGLSYLTKLCSVKDSDSWAIRMEQLLEAEAPTKLRKERMAGAYNRGFLGYQPAHRSCSDASRQAIERFLEQGQKITIELARRYGG
jgi:uncharacterized protein (TIGR02301 family)